MLTLGGEIPRHRNDRYYSYYFCRDAANPLDKSRIHVKRDLHQDACCHLKCNHSSIKTKHKEGQTSSALLKYNHCSTTNKHKRKDKTSSISYSISVDNVIADVLARHEDF